MSSSCDLPYFVYRIDVDGLVRYVGKGSRSRHLDHARKARRVNRLRDQGQPVKASLFVNRLAKAIRGGADVTAHIIARYASEHDALAAETLLISGMAQGTLWNGNDGGAGCTSEAAKAAWQDLTRKSRASEAAKRMWSDPLIRASIAKKRAESRSHKQDSEASKKRWANPEYAEKQRARWRDPEYRAATLAKQKAGMSRQSVRAARSAEAQAKWSDPSYRSKHAASMATALATPAVKAKISEASKAMWADPQMRDKIIAAQRAKQTKKLSRDGRGSNAEQERNAS